MEENDLSDLEEALRKVERVLAETRKPKVKATATRVFGTSMNGKTYCLRLEEVGKR